MQINEGLKVYDSLTLQQREARLRRSGVEAVLVSGERGKQPGWIEPKHSMVQRETQASVANDRRNPLPPASTHFRQSYRIIVFNLTVLEILPLGAGSAMKVAAGSAGGTGREADGAGGRQRSGGSQEAEGGPSQEEAETDRNADTGEYGAAYEDAAAAPDYWSQAGERRGILKLLQSVAIRALYGLGLDSGEVVLAALGDRRYAVERIEPLRSARVGPYRSAAASLARSVALEQPGRPGLLMGMDPEFLLLRESTGRVVPASRYLPTDGVAGCDAGPSGTRGVFPVAELRPQPRREPRALLAQLMSAARTADRLIADRSLRWRAGGMPLRGWALGGHLHFSGVTLSAPLLRALDNYLALPLLLLEDARAGARRPRYGVLGDFRHQPHGGFEYRTLPSFLVSPVIAKGAVHLAHLIVSHYEDLPLRPLDREDLHAAYYSGDKALLRAAFPPLAKQLRHLSGYPCAAPCIEPLFRFIAEERTWDESRDIRALWCGGEKG
ncbi:putative amidoligase domain-containing protein [Paenibacillus donghaensis]|uniref:Phage phiEco32-like COOH-NH2 ligase-type 2 n=1 Tax=Paenibacillus donghaensis TaxID=414771 RepID=A0A2Z2KIE8_9BACL|nr:hypothetical protein [Paenibacillus donghaensis]ASA22009.1 hypothetical protein B9T62_15235 [Paenibacillus donghaensis]